MLINSKEYLKIVESIKAQIATTRQKVIINANHELLRLYWNIGKTINENVKYGNSFIQNLARDIKSSFPDMKGFSERNLYYMANFAGIYTDIEILQQVAAKLNWRHHQTLINRIKDTTEIMWYAQQTIENGWSSNILDMQIKSALYQRQVLAEKTTNFKANLSPPQGELAEEAMKDPYIFDFITYRKGMVEREVEKELVRHITEFLLELGSGFSFVGEQYHLEIDGKDFYIDLLFYNLKLRCYVVIELKMTEFKPEYAGKLNFYISAVDDTLKHEYDHPTIGILLCATKSKIIAEYALKDINKPISVNEFNLLEQLPKEYENILPSAEDIEKRLKLPDIEED